MKTIDKYSHPFENFVSNIKHQQLKLTEVFNTLQPIEAYVLELRYGLNGKKQHTLKETGLKLLDRKLSQERVRQIQCKALRKLNHPSRLKILIGQRINI